MLTDREREILELADFSNDEIAERLNLSVGTVKWYFSHLMIKFKAKTRTRLYKLALQNGYIDLKKEGA